jgi:hypothetical protein
MVAGVVIALVTATGHAEAQDASAQIASRIEGVKTGQVRMSFRARDGVCGNGANWSRRNTDFETIRLAASRDIEVDCDRGPVRVVVVRERGVTTDIRVYVGARWHASDSASDIGTVSAVAAGRWLLSAVGSSDPRPARGAMLAATLTDSIDSWPTLVQIARNEALNGDVRNQAVYLLSEFAGERVTASLDSVAYDAGDREVRKQAIFAMSRRPPEEAVPNLLRMAESLKDRELRRLAVYWLGRTKDPRAVEFFEKVLAVR